MGTRNHIITPPTRLLHVLYILYISASLLEQPYYQIHIYPGRIIELTFRSTTNISLLGGLTWDRSSPVFYPLSVSLLLGILFNVKWKGLGVFCLSVISRSLSVHVLLNLNINNSFLINFDEVYQKWNIWGFLFHCIFCFSFVINKPAELIELSGNLLLLYKLWDVMIK